jgi:hypothetical protein
MTTSVSAGSPRLPDSSSTNSGSKGALWATTTLSISDGSTVEVTSAKGGGTTEVLVRDTVHRKCSRADTPSWIGEAMEAAQLPATSEPHQSYLTYPISKERAQTCGLDIHDREGSLVQRHVLKVCLHPVS